jgi:uncharacterized membrane protein YoaK (UPF0700 family)
MSVRILNVLIGTWLLLSAFAWPHQPVQGVVTMACAVVIVLSSLASIYSQRFRYVTAFAALVLFLAALTSAHGLERTVWHNAAIAVVVFFTSLVDRGVRREQNAATDDQLSRPVGQH